MSTKEEKKEPRPNPTTMEGMIYNANHILGKALSKHINGLPKRLFEEAVGVAVIHTVELGFVLTGTMGSGIILKKTETGWSPPCAVGLTGLGFGIQGGISGKDLVVFILDDPSMEAMTTKHGFKFGSQIEVTAVLGRAGTSDFEFTKKGVGATFAIAYSKGVFAGLSLEGSVLGTREFVNNKFYSEATDAKEILYTPGAVTIPEYKLTMLNEVYDKLKKLEEGATAEKDDAEKEKESQALDAAEKEHESVKESTEVEKVDAPAEATEAGDSTAEAAK